MRELNRDVQDLEIVFGDGRALDTVRAIVLDEKAEMKARQRALRTLIENRPDDLRSVCEKVSNIRVLNGTALSGLALFDDPEIAKLIVNGFQSFHPSDRPRAIETLIARPSWAMVMLQVIEKGKGRITASDLTASQARQIAGLGDVQLTEKLNHVWGQLRESNDDRRKEIQHWKTQLTRDVIEKANLGHGRLLFNQVCANCHTLYGQGQRVGPDLTGAQRGNLDYLLENILDPSAVVGKDYRLSRILTTDGRVLSGLVVNQDKNLTVLQTATERLTVANEDIEDIAQSALSAMPDGLLQNLTPQQVTDLIGYLMHPTQVSLP